MLSIGTFQHLDWDNFQIAFLHWFIFVHCHLIWTLSHHSHPWRALNHCLFSYHKDAALYSGMVISIIGNRSISRNHLNELPDMVPFSSLLSLFVSFSQQSRLVSFLKKSHFALAFRDVSINDITEIPGNFDQWFELLNFNYNSLTSIPEMLLDSARSSSRYFFDYNKISKLPKMHVSQMKTLSLSYNSIKEFPTSFSSLNYLFVLLSYYTLMYSCFTMICADGLITTNWRSWQSQWNCTTWMQTIITWRSFHLSTSPTHQVHAHSLIRCIFPTMKSLHCGLACHQCVTFKSCLHEHLQHHLWISC